MLKYYSTSTLNEKKCVYVFFNQQG